MDIKSMTLDELKDACQQMGEKPFRAKQLYDWMHHRLAGSYDEMTNLSLAFREKLKEQYPLTCLEKVQVQESKIDGTRKYLFRLSDGNVIESVWMKYHHGNSVCISSQVVKLDTKYISEWSFLLDIRILFKTVLIVLGQKGSM